MADWWQEKPDEEDEVDEEDLFHGSAASPDVPTDLPATERATAQLPTDERAVPAAAMPTAEQPMDEPEKPRKPAKPRSLGVVGAPKKKKKQKKSLAPKSALDNLEPIADPKHKPPAPSGDTRSDGAEGESIATGTGSLVLGKLLGRGGMAEVRLAHRTGPGGFSRKVVIKRILPEHANDPTFVQRFIREASLAARLHHPNIVEILELGAKEGDYFTVMEFLDGKNLRDVVRKLNKMKQRLPPHLGAQVVSAVAKALDFAHNFTDDDGKVHRIVHRDVSPDNIMITFAGETKLIDFGVAKDLDVTSLTLADHVVGKPLYLPPESLKGGKPNQSWDIYGLGVVFYQLLAGRPPFTPGSGPQGLANLLREIVHSQPPPVQEIAEDIDDALAHIVRKGMAKDPDERYTTVGDFSRAVDEYLVTHAPSSRHSLASILAEMYGRDSESSSPAAVVATPMPTPTMRSTELPTDLGTDITDDGTPPPDRDRDDDRDRVPRRRRRRRRIDPRLLLGIGGGTFALVAIVVWVAASLASRNVEERPPFGILVPPVTAPLPPTHPPVAPIGDPVIPVPVPVKQGFIQVKCSVAGWVYVDDKPKGLCPISSIPVAVGKHKVALEARGRTKVRSVYVKKNQKIVADFRPPRKTGPTTIPVR